MKLTRLVDRLEHQGALIEANVLEAGRMSIWPKSTRLARKWEDMIGIEALEA